MGVPQLLGQYLPLDQSLIGITRPAEAVVLAFAGALSTSAFIFPVLKERGWEDEESGEAATSILLLQDLLVAPLLVLLPFVVGETATDYTAFGYLTAKATLGFGAIMYVASFILRRLFMLVAQTQSTETFVALCLLVAAGMGTIAKFFGLTDTAGAFAAGVLLANTNYRSQIQADILPFKGILLGIFFMDAGSTFDSELVLAEWPTILVGAVSLLVLKAVTLGAATRVPRWMEPNRLSLADGVRVALLLCGGGEFAFVVLALASKLSLISQDLSAILTAIILITMGVTPLLGQLAATLSDSLVDLPDDKSTEVDVVNVNGLKKNDVNVLISRIANDAIVVCGYGEVGRSLVQVLNSEVPFVRSASTHSTENDVVNVVAFDTTPALSRSLLQPGPSSVVIFGDGANADVIRSSGIRNPAAIFISYEDPGRAVSATARLRASFTETPIFVRAARRAEVVSLTAAGATEVVVEADALPRAAPALLLGVWPGNVERDPHLPSSVVEFHRAAAAAAAGISLAEVDQLLQLFAGMDQNVSGFVTVQELERVLERSTNWIATDNEIADFNAWIETNLRHLDPLDAMEFCRLYARAPEYVRKAFGVTKQ
jgi:Kef-type K+ transport system membrane component KefB/Trk K+ transport system NAD-binding subunit